MNEVFVYEVMNEVECMTVFSSGQTNNIVQTSYTKLKVSTHMLLHMMYVHLVSLIKVSRIAVQFS